MAASEELLDAETSTIEGNTKQLASFYGSASTLEKYESRVTIVLARFICGGSSISEGYMFGFLSVANLFVATDLGLTELESGSLDGFFYFFMCFGGLTTGWLADKAGRKFAISLCYMVVIIGYFSLAVAWDYFTFVFGLSCAGAGVGAGLASVTMYFTEITPAEVRGQFVSLEEVFVVLGILLGSMVGWLFYCLEYVWKWNASYNLPCWRSMGLLGIIIPLVLLILMQLSHVPESPRYLLLAGRVAEAKKVLVDLVGKSEAAWTLHTWEHHDANSEASWRQVIWNSKPAQRRSLHASLFIMFAQQSSGIPVATVYLGKILTDILGTVQASLLACVGFAALRTIAAWTSTCFVDSHGRRPVFGLSLGGMCLGWLLLSVSYIADPGAAVKMTLLVFVCVSYDSGVGPVAYPYCGEALDNTMRSKGVSCAIAVKGLTAFVLVECCPFVIRHLGFASTFALLGCICVFCFGWAYCHLPETSNRHLEDVEKLFM